ncbi:TPA: hypothetical protein DIU27_04510 [Candidatus Collierbacteria bacterium]|nr:MAG: hypothetical protein UW31_C0013G0048 [Candidatus Collierbacteria bacterium GW2011_GWA2_44_13]KKT50123.1 MAG: hypothetical protein UW42_C0024G0021 [Candidatus Collierbacteria bacterium GW2011_GWB1_44_197]KKT62526.1 MAG: hypothetical protein UW56_C0006G0049 [Candidatus Collierbacteria bacterium GW2011_GWD1_44_27]KKT88775.1 MAG: hypothetical protein UW88_C0008G0049 [Candidatus Collierbacteria bacterium GW2011_GWD2_45_10]HCQ31612.1 hypothetical protein [Candidatus Collierbacteria bacterium]
MRKSSLEIIDNSLFLYGALVTFILTFAGFFNLNDTQGLIALGLFLPVSFYFIIKVYSAAKRLFHTENFSLTNFIHQSETTFLINLVLLCFAIVMILFRISVQIIK